jgi:hypothetical protein
LYAGTIGRDPDPGTGEHPMQSARPRDLGALILAIGVLLVLFVVSLTLGSPLT